MEDPYGSRRTWGAVDFGQIPKLGRTQNIDLGFAGLDDQLLPGSSERMSYRTSGSIIEC
jgi:hypothetical protein